MTSSCPNWAWLSFACGVVGGVLLLFGGWMSGKIADNLLHDTAAAIALDISHFYEPLLQELTTRPELNEPSLRALDALFDGTEFRREVVAVKIWTRGRIVYSSKETIIGQASTASPSLLRAWNGEVQAEFDSQPDEPDRNPGEALLKIYAPVRASGNGHIIAVAELFTPGGRLQADLRAAFFQSWAIVGGLALLHIGHHYITASRGRRMLEAQHAALAAARRAALDTNERFLRRVGAELHDGAAQLVGFALLRLESLRPLIDSKHSESDDLQRIRVALHDSLREIRHLSAGLAPPDLEGMSLDDALRWAVLNHEQRTGTAVNANVGALPARVSPLLKICIYRFVQEGLNNAYRHAGGVGQAVYAAGSDQELSIEVADAGSGFSLVPSGREGGLGLAGLRERVESLGGTFCLDSQPNSGTRLRASFRAKNGVF
jgi:signal transduction histidine kinase